jgi:hypothetical protein
MTNEKLTRSWHFVGAICLCLLVAFSARNAFAQDALFSRDRATATAAEFEQRMREKDEQIARDIAEYYSTVEVERKVGPHVLKVPLNYISAFGLKPGRIEPSQLHITVMLPSLRGMTKENWRPASVEGGILRDRMIITLGHKRIMSPGRDADGEQVERYFETFIASAPAIDSEMGQDFYVYNAYRTRLPLPSNCSDYCRILGDSGPQNSFYLMCQVSRFSEPKRSTSCAAYFLDHSRGFYLRTYVPVAYVPIWKNIRLTFASLLEEWLVR